MPETFGAGAWYDNTVRVDEHDGEPYIIWNDQTPVKLIAERDGLFGVLHVNGGAVLSAHAAVRAFALVCKFEAVVNDFGGRLPPDVLRGAVNGDTVDTTAIGELMRGRRSASEPTATPAAAEPPAPPKRASRKRGEVA